MSKLLTSSAVMDKLHAAGVFKDDPRMVRRVVIDIEAGCVVRAYVERFVDDEALDIALTGGLTLVVPEDPDGR